jgi:hypothetical protein
MILGRSDGTSSLRGTHGCFRSAVHRQGSPQGAPRRTRVEAWGSRLAAPAVPRSLRADGAVLGDRVDVVQGRVGSGRGSLSGGGSDELA